MTTVVLYGLKTCDACKKARKWLEGRDVAHRFHDVREDGLDEKLLSAWAKELGWERLLNKSSTTWRGLPEADKEGVDEKRALALILKHPALLKRPVFDLGTRRMVGFDEKALAAILK